MRTTSSANLSARSPSIFASIVPTSSLAPSSGLATKCPRGTARGTRSLALQVERRGRGGRKKGEERREEARKNSLGAGGKNKMDLLELCHSSQSRAETLARFEERGTGPLPLARSTACTLHFCLELLSPCIPGLRYPSRCWLRTAAQERLRVQCAPEIAPA